MQQLIGGCHCGNIVVDVHLTSSPETCQPRACDCDFCRKHGAAWISDSKGSLRIEIRNAHESGSYRQGSGQAELLLCKSCGVLVAVLFRTDMTIHGAVNVRALAGAAQFSGEQAVSPQKLSPSQKASRWQDIWFSDVEIATSSQ